MGYIQRYKTTSLSFFCLDAIIMVTKKGDMHMLSFKLLNPNDEKFYELYSQAYSWDKSHYCFPSKEPKEFLGLFSKYFGLYKEETFIGFGIFNLNISLSPRFHIKLNESEPVKEKIEVPKEPDKIELAYIINPNYRNLGYGSKLVEYLIQKAEEEHEVFELIEVEILKKNKASISLIEKHDFNFKCFNEKTIVFQKTIKNRI